MEHWAAKKKNEEAENQFRRLPDDVVLNIFDKISDIKWLCRGFLVSKRFSCLISRVQTVSVKRMSCKYGFLGELPKDSPLYLSGFRFLSVFTRIRSLNLEIASHFKGYNGSVFKWGAKFTAKHHGVMLLYAKSLSKMNEAEEEAEDETEIMITRKRLIPRLKLGLEFRIAFNLDRMRPMAVAGMLELENMRVGYVPLLQLPMSRYLMKVVTIATFVPNGDDDSEAESAMLDAFVEEQGVFSEAVDQILKNHKDVIKAFNFYDLIDA
ncbi:hypothetical protein RHMOL_Rhmol13G0144700 [Rhododendron molle]|uniref:Uncharacterized protein n=1 Tax=Rhododendron molle TaxID=49168 RepID=A0ACC0L6T6_RHOML|nr:hypothetical protein RHMOL_Rhmol13G0144700 [Rhododendron molle]